MVLSAGGVRCRAFSASSLICDSSLTRLALDLDDAATVLSVCAYDARRDAIDESEREEGREEEDAAAPRREDMAETRRGVREVGVAG